MAAIYNPGMQQGQSQFQQPDPVLSIQSRQPQISQAQDPLFEALAKYITSGPGPSSVTASEVESIISSHANQEGGRAYLESIVSPIQPPGFKIWKRKAIPKGFLSTNMSSLTLVFSATRNEIFQKLEFRGNCPGFYPPQVFEFPDTAKFYWDDLADNMAVIIEVEYLALEHKLAVKFFDGSNKWVAELQVPDATLRLPPMTLKGTGLFTFPDGPQ